MGEKGQGVKWAAGEMWYRVRRKRKKVIAPAKPEAQAVIQLVVDGGFI